MKTALLSGLPQLGLRLSDAQADTFCRFGVALLEKNQVMNLTAITDPQEVARLHFLDCMALLNVADFQNKSVIDVGCGAGFPGVPLKIAEPSIDLTLLDSLKKRVDWLSEVLPQLGLEAECVSARAEEYALQHRERYDLAVSRAVARLSMLSELCLPLVSVGGAFVAMKSVDSDEEISQAARGIGLLGGKVEKILDYPIPGTDAVHRAVVIRKVKKTPAQYPRRFAKIKQSPL
jgi:16S rRNA (guanine527-N7)-methyltransferase